MHIDLDARHGALVGRLYRRSGADRWRLPRRRLVEALEDGLRRRFGSGDVADREIAAHLKAVRIEDLALACACADGDEAAWEHFVRTYRPVLYRAAGAMAGAGGRELADSLYAELFGLDERDGRRQSLLRYFHGRSSLATWLRSVLAQRHVDAIRATRRDAPLVSEPEAVAMPDGGPGAGDHATRTVSSGPMTADAEPVDLDRARLVAAFETSLSAAVRSLEPGERLRLFHYYRDGLTLARIGRLLGEHEATVSRKLARTRASIRQAVEGALQRAHGLSEPEIERCFAYAAEPMQDLGSATFEERGVQAPAAARTDDR